MTNPSSSSHMKGVATKRLPFFIRIDYPYWKTKMTWFLQSTNLDLWDIIKDGPTIPSKLVDEVMVLKLKYEWDEHDKRNV